jgi:polysaccharide export outer membrane protein
LLAFALAGCAGGADLSAEDMLDGPIVQASDYLIGPGDTLQIFVWDQPDLTTAVQVRPDGRISTPLVDDLVAAGVSPTSLARAIEGVLSTFVRSPVVTVSVQGFVGASDQQIRVVGEAVQPQALQYNEGMRILDVMIAAGGLSEFAAGNRASVIRYVDGEERRIRVRLGDLLSEGDVSQNLRMMPGDIVVIPLSVF